MCVTFSTILTLITLTVSSPWTTLWLALPTSFRVCFYRCLEYLGARIYERNSSRVKRLPFGLYVKIHTIEAIRTEALSMIFVGKNTTIPVPTVLDVVPHPQGAAMIMTTIPGESVRYAILEGKLSQEDFETVISDWLAQLRAIPAPPYGLVCGFPGGRCMTYWVCDQERFGPYSSLQALHKWFIRGIEERCKFTQNVYSKPLRLCFTHADIHVHNILYHEGRMSGLIDWECAGWWPEYWEYATAMWHHGRWPFWAGAFGNVFAQYDEEMDMVRGLWKLRH